MSAISFEHVSKRYAAQGVPAGAPAVNDCSFEAPAGALVVLLGPSGCGKTTLLKMANRLYEPDAGTIRLAGDDIRRMDVIALRRQIGYQIQQVGLFPHMTVAQNIAVVPQLLGWTRPRIEERIDELLALVELSPEQYRRRYPAQLSGGQQQRVGLARALAGDPQVLLMDEPFGAIDAITRLNLQDEMLRLQAKLHKTILFVTHDVDEALRLADQLVIMRAGKVLQTGTPLSVLSQPANDFVSDLVGADDLLRQLGLLRISSAMGSLPADVRYLDGPQIDAHADLRHALTQLLCTGAPALTVCENTGAGEMPVGILTLEHIREAATGRRCA
jgi:osmoprotectant transport system ATP-binding protein